MGCIKEADSSDYRATDAINAKEAQANQDSNGDPVNMVTGAFTFAEHDLSIPTQRLTIDLTRHYNNQLHDSSPQAVISGFGRGWSHSLSMHLEPGPGPAQISYVDDLGTRIVFEMAFDHLDIASGQCSLKLEENGFHVLRGNKILAAFTRAGEFLPPVKDQEDEKNLEEAAGQIMPQITMGPDFFQITFKGLNDQNLIFDLPDHGCRFIPPAGSLALVLRRREDGAFSLRQIDGLTAWFSTTGQLTRLVRPGPRADSQITLSYDSKNRLVAAVGAGRRWIKFEYQKESALIQQVHDHTGRCWQYFYNNLQELVEVQDPANRVRRYGYLEWTGSVATGKGKTAETVIRALNKIYPFVEKGKTPASKPELTNQYTSDRRVTRQKDILGQVTRFDYNRFTYTTYLTDPAGWTTVYAFNANGNTTKVRKPGGGTKEYIYDQRCNLLAEIDEVGCATYYAKLKDPNRFNRQKEYGQRANGNRSAYVTPGDDEIELGYDAFGNRPLICDALGNETRFLDYNQIGRPRKIILPNGNTIVYSYDERSGLPLRTETEVKVGRLEPQTRVQKWEYDDIGNPIRYEEFALDRRGTSDPKKVVVIEYDNDRHHPILRKEWLENEAYTGRFEAEERYTWDALGRLVSRTTLHRRGLSDETLFGTIIFGYDLLGQEVWKIDADEKATCCIRNQQGLVTETFILPGAKPENLSNVPIEERMHRERWEYDALGQEVTYIDPGGAKTVRKWNSTGKCIKIIEPNGFFTEFEYDKDRNQTSKKFENGFQVKTLYDKVGRPTVFEDSSGGYIGQTYDPLGRVQEVIEGKEEQAYRIGYKYDVLGNLCLISYPNEIYERLVIDELGLLICREKGTKDHPGLYIESYTYDECNRRTSISAGSRDKLHLLFSLKYLDHLRSVQVVDSLGNESQTFFDSIGNVIRKVDCEGRAVNFEYDGMNRILRQWSDNQTVMSVFHYNSLGQLDLAREQLVQYRYQYDQAGRVERHEQSIGTDHIAISYSYDDKGRLIAKNVNDAWWMRYTYASQSPYILETNIPGKTVLFKRDEAGRLIEEKWSDGGIVEYAFDSKGNSIGKDCYDENRAKVSSQRIIRDSQGRPLKEIRSNILGENLSDYSYDALNELVGINHIVDGTVRPYRRYIYDELGNRVEEHRDGKMFATYQYDEACRLISQSDSSGKTTIYRYDRNGNLIQKGNTTFAYDALQRLICVTTDGNEKCKVDYCYSPIGTLAGIQKTTHAQVEFAVYDGFQQIISRKPDSEEYFYWGFQVDSLFAAADVDRQTRRAYTDIAGSFSSIDPHTEWHEYEPFGDQCGNDGFSYSFGFMSKRLEQEAGLYYGRARFYDPTSGRFTQPDPLGTIDNLNLYLYAKNNPLIYADPTGLASCKVDSVKDAQGSLGVFPKDPFALSNILGPEFSHPHVGKTRDNTLQVEWQVGPVNIRYESHTDYHPDKPNSPRHLSPHYHVSIDGHKIAPSDYAKGYGTGFLPGERIPIEVYQALGKY